MPRIRILLTLLLLALAAPTPAWAVIEKLTKLADLVRDAESIAVLRVASVSEKGVVFEAESDVAGELRERRLAMSLAKVSPEERDSLLKRIGPETRVLFFDTPNGDVHLGLIYSEGSWFSLVGNVDGEKVRWQVTHSEPYLRRTFHGSTAELATVIALAKAGQGKLPEPESSLKPGLGPEASATPPNDVPPPIEPLPPAVVEAPSPTAEIETPAPSRVDDTNVPPSVQTRWLLAGLVVVATVIALALNLRLS